MFFPSPAAGLGKTWVSDLRLLPLVPHFSLECPAVFRSGWGTAFCCSCCRWQQKPDKTRLASREEMSSGPGSLERLCSPQGLDWELRD